MKFVIDVPESYIVDSALYGKILSKHKERE